MKAFRVTLPNKESLVVVTKRGLWSDMIAVTENLPDKDNTYISEISLWQFIKFILRQRRYKR